MAYLSEEALLSMGFESLGKNVLISEKASLYDVDRLSIGDNSRIDDFCVVAGRVSIGRNVHVTVFGNVAGGRAGVRLEDFATLAYGCHVIAQTDDYSGKTMTNSTIPERFKAEVSAETVVGRYAILGTGTIVLPGASIAEGVSSGAGTVFVRPTQPWSVYLGCPAQLLKQRSRDLLDLADEYLRTDGSEG